MINSANSQKKNETRELKQKYFQLKKQYCRIAAVLKHIEEELESAQRELSINIEKENIGAEKLIVALKKQNKQLRKFNNTKDKFISIIAHDLKSPFNSIIGFSRLLHQKIHTEHYDKAKEIAGIILHSANSAMELLQDLMEWALIQTENIEFKPEKIILSDVVKQIEVLFADVIDQKGIAFQNELSEEISIYADQEMISVVLRNLISNAIKFTDKGGKITVSAKHAPHKVIISVADTGMGIPDNRLKDLFLIDKCYKRNGTNKEGGTGLGLILCKEFIEKHKGKIWVKSKVGVGSTFLISIPTDNNLSVTS